MRQSDAEKRSGAHLRRFPWSSMSVFDVSMDETSICVVDSDGTIIKESKAATDPTAIHSALKAYTDRLQRVGLEAQAFSPWLSKELSAMGLPVIVVEAVHMQKALSVQRTE